MIPTYNERENIERLINEILNVDSNIHILVVDDSSPDGTGEIVDKIASKSARVHILHRKERGRASAGIAGFKKALELGFDYIIEMDADFSHNPKYISTMLKEIKNSDIVIGSKYLKGGEAKTVNRSKGSMLISKLANAFNRVVLGLNVSDSSGGYKCYRREVLEAIGLDKIISTGYSIGAELLYRAKKKGFSFKEIPIVFQNRQRGKSKENYKIIISYPLTILRLRFLEKL